MSKFLKDLDTPPPIEVSPRTFTITLTETQVSKLVERLKFRQSHIPDATESMWRELEKKLGYAVEEIDL